MYKFKLGDPAPMQTPASAREALATLDAQGQAVVSSDGVVRAYVYIAGTEARITWFYGPNEAGDQMLGSNRPEYGRRLLRRWLSNWFRSDC